MSEIKALEELRELACDINGQEIIDHMQLYPSCVFDGTWLDSWHREFDRLANAIQAEVDERFMELPEGWTTEQACEVLGYWPRWDDGAPCMFGDVFSTPRYSYDDKNEKLEILRIFARDHVFKKQDGTPYEEEHGGYYEWNYFRPGGEGCEEYKPHHVKPRTLEDVLCDLEGMRGNYDDYEDVVCRAAKYAAEIRELLGVDA